MNFTGTQEFIFAVVGPLILLAALIYGTVAWRKRSAAARQAAERQTRENYRLEDARSKGRWRETSRNESSLVPTDEDIPTEDDMQRAHLGGVKGSPDLPPAPLTKTEREQMP